MFAVPLICLRVTCVVSFLELMVTTSGLFEDGYVQIWHDNYYLCVFLVLIQYLGNYHLKTEETCRNWEEERRERSRMKFKCQYFLFVYAESIQEEMCQVDKKILIEQRNKKCREGEEKMGEERGGDLDKEGLQIC